MDREDSAKLSQLVTIVSISFVIGVLYFASQVLQPLAMSILLTFLLAPMVSRLERHGIGRVPAVLSTIGVLFLIIVAVGWAVTGQVMELSENLHTYQGNLTERIHAIRDAGKGMLSDASEVVTELADEAAGERDPAVETETEEAEPPVEVAVVDASPIPMRILRDWLGPVLSPLGTLAVILLFMIFMLIYREDLRDRLIQLTGTRQLSVTTQALDEAGRRVSSYLLRLSIVNSTYGLSVALGLWVIGIPNPFLWGFLAAVLRFIPYVGPWIAATLPIALSLAAFDGWERPLATIGLFVVLELVSNNIIEPWLYGQGTGVSVIGFIAAALFWTWLWGPLGLVLSMPMTVCLTVMGRYVPGLKFVTVLFSDQPALDTKLRFYQRLLALDYHEASEVVDEFLADHSVEELYANVLLPALSLTERDRQKGQLADVQRQFIYQFIRGTLHEQTQGALDDNEGDDTKVGALADGCAVVVGPAEARRIVATVTVNAEEGADVDPEIVCLPAEDDVDELAGEMIAQLLRARGYAARAETSESLRAGLKEVIHPEATRLVVISAVAPGGSLNARDLCRRLRWQSRDLRVIVGLWNAGGELIKTRQRLASAGANGVATKLEEGLELMEGDPEDEESAATQIIG